MATDRPSSGMVSLYLSTYATQWSTDVSNTIYLKIKKDPLIKSAQIFLTMVLSPCEVSVMFCSCSAYTVVMKHTSMYIFATGFSAYMLSHFQATSTVLFVYLLHLFVCCMHCIGCFKLSWAALKTFVWGLLHFQILFQMVLDINCLCAYKGSTILVKCYCWVTSDQWSPTYSFGSVLS